MTIPEKAQMLIIDDEPRILESLKILLEGKGHDVSIASNGLEGIKLLAGSHFALAIVDLVMPGEDGLVVMDYIKSNSPDTLVIVMTGHASLQSAIDSLRKGAYDYIVKPFDSNTLETVVQRAIDQASLRHRLKLSEARHFNLFKECPEAIVIDRDRKVFFANEAYFRLVGRKEKEIIGSDTLRFVEKKDRYKIQICKEQSIAADLSFKRKDGTIRIAEVCVKGFSEDGADATVIFAHDITDRKRMEEELVKSEKLRAIGEMASGVTHDFNNVLTAIMGNTQLLLTQVRDKTLCRYLHNIELAAQDAAQTIKRLQNFNRIKSENDFELVDVAQLAGDVINITEPRWNEQHQDNDKKAITMVTELLPVPLVACHPSEIREVITNLVFNAMEALSGRGGSLAIKTRHIPDIADPDSGHVEIIVHDTGHGMPRDISKKIFNPFFSTKGAHRCGVGLSVSYGIVNQHGGKILVESRKGEGTTFTVQLPVARVSY
ncbi:MAG: response regulator [Pseudomonadota bacterium]